MGMIEDKHFSSSTKRHSLRCKTTKHKTRCKPITARCSKGSNQWKEKCKPGFKLTLLDLCKDRIEIAEYEHRSKLNSSIEKEVDSCDYIDKENIDFECGDVANESDKCCVCPQERCFMPKRDLKDSCEDYPNIEEPMANTVCGCEDREDKEEFDDFCCECPELDCEDSYEEDCEYEELDLYEKERIENKIRYEFEELMNGCFSVDSRRLAKICDKYTLYDECIPLWLDSELEIYGDENCDCYCNSHEGTPWRDVKKKIIQNLIDYKRLYGDITCIYDGDDKSANSITERLESGLLRDWCLCLDRSNSSKKYNSAGGDAFNEISTCYGDCLPHKRYCKTAQHKIRSNKNTSKKKKDSFYHMTAQNRNCNHPYSSDNEFNNTDDPDKKEELFYDEEVDELFVINAPTTEITNDVNSTDDIYFQACNDETDIQKHECSSESIFYTDTCIPSYGKPKILSETEDVMVERVTEGINKIFNLVDDLPKSGAFAYRTPLGHREEELKVTLMNCKNETAEGTVCDDDAAKLFADETSTNANCNADEIDFGNDSNSESVNNEDNLFEESDDDDDSHTDSDYNDEEEEEYKSAKPLGSGELLNEVNKNVLKESALVPSNTSALVISSSQESNESQNLIDSYDAIGMSRSNSDNQSDSDTDVSEQSSHDDDLEPRKSRKGGAFISGLKSVLKSWADTSTDLQSGNDKTEKYTLIKQQGWRSPIPAQPNEMKQNKDEDEKDLEAFSDLEKNQTNKDNENDDSPMMTSSTARSQSPEKQPDPTPQKSDYLTPVPLNQVGKGDEDPTQKVVEKSLEINKSPKIPNAETHRNFAPYKRRKDSDNESEPYEQQDDSAEVRKSSADRGGMFSYKPPSVPEKSPDTNQEESQRPPYVLSPKARQLIMENRYGKQIDQKNRKNAKKTNNRVKPKEASLQAIGDHGEAVRFNPPLTKRDIENAEIASKDIRKAKNKKTHIQELKDQTRGIHRPGRLRKPKRVSLNLEDKSWSNMGPFQDDIDDDDMAVEQDSIDNPELLSVDTEYDDTASQRVMMPKAYRDGKDINAISKKVIVPKGYTMQKKVTDQQEVEEMNMRREQLRQERREMMANLTNKAKDQNKPKLIPADRPVSPINDAASKFASRAKEEYMLKKPTVAVHMRGGNGVTQGTKKLKHAGGRGNMREPISNQSNDGRYSWAADRRGSKDFYKKYGGDYQTSADSPFSQLFEEKQRKSEPKKRFEKYRLKKLDPEIDPYDNKTKKTSYSDEEDDENRITMPYTALQFNHLTHNAKAIAQQRNQRWRPRVVKREPIKSPTEVKIIQNEDKVHEIITREAEVPDEPADADKNYKMMTFKIKSKQDTAQIMPVGVKQASGEDDPCSVAAVNMYKAIPEERAIKRPTILPCEPEQHPGLLSKLNPFKWFGGPNKQGMKMGDVGDYGDGKAQMVGDQKYENEKADKEVAPDPRESHVIHQGSSVDVAIAAPCGLATDESRDAWKTDAERLKQQRREKLKGLMESKRRKDDAEFAREEHKRYNRSNNRDNSDNTENKSKMYRGKTNANNHPTTTGWREGMQRKKQEGQAKYNNMSNNCSITEENSEEKICKNTSNGPTLPKIDYFADYNNNASKSQSLREKAPLDKMLKRSYEDGEKIKSTIELLIEWYLISLVVLLILFLPVFCPCLFKKVFICPVPSICTVVSSILMAPFEIVGGLLFGVSKKDAAPSAPPPPPIYSAPESVEEKAPPSYPGDSIWSSPEQESVDESSSWFAQDYDDERSDEEERAMSKLNEMVNSVANIVSTVGKMTLSLSNLGQGREMEEVDAVDYEDATKLAKLKNSEPLFHLFVGWEQRKECDKSSLYSFWQRLIGSYPPHCL